VEPDWKGLEEPQAWPMGMRCVPDGEPPSAEGTLPGRLPGRVLRPQQNQKEKRGVDLDRVLIRGGLVVDGTGRPGCRADVALEEGRIAEIGAKLSGPARQVIEADGLVVAPGFIDIHSHSDGSVFAHPLSESKVLQGVTSEVVGNCGIGAFPVTPEQKEELLGYLKIHEFVFAPAGITWTDLGEYARAVEALGPGPNIIPLVAHGALRSAAMGFEDREPAAAELTRMEELLAQALEQGAWGLSTGLIYPPGSFARTDELIALARVLARYGALYASHIRGESGTLLTALDEAIAIGAASGARVEVSHLKALGRPQWGQGKECLARLAAARARGVDVGADQYPYEASSTSLTALVPQWAHSGGAGELLKRLAAPELRERLETEIEREMLVRGGPERVLIAGVGSAKNAGVSGQTLAQIAQGWGLSPAAAVVRLLLEEKAAVGAVYFSMAEDDVEAILADERVAVGSDGRGMNAEADAGEATHPRSYGTFARVLGRYVREKGLLSLETAVYKMTGLPAERLRLTDRGRLRPGLAADVTVFDPAQVADRADFANPHRYATGIEYVFVNGCPIVAAGRLTGRAGGRVLRKDLRHARL